MDSQFDELSEHGTVLALSLADFLNGLEPDVRPEVYRSYLSSLNDAEFAGERLIVEAALKLAKMTD